MSLQQLCFLQPLDEIFAGHAGPWTERIGWDCPIAWPEWSYWTEPCS